MNRWIDIIQTWIITTSTSRPQAVEFGFASVSLCILYFVLQRYPGLSSRVVIHFRKSIRNTKLYVFAAMMLPLAIRLAFLPWFPVPEPHVHDEFGHLLVADTLAAGRLANPPHPLWRHLETIYVLQQPSYSSIYPIGQGSMLAIGNICFGHPWAGVLLSVALMTGAIAWMLFGCLPPGWAAVGGLIFSLHLGLSAHWMNSYWGGAVSAFGGALLFGALCRMRRKPSVTMALVIGLGWSIVWFTRPFESVPLLLIFWGLLATLFLQRPTHWRSWLAPIGLIITIQLCAGGITALHNLAVTGSIQTLPYQLAQKAYGVPQSLLWQPVIAEPPLQVVELKQMYQWQRDYKERGSARPLRQLRGNLHTAWSFFVKPWFSLPMLALLFLLRDRLVLLATGIMACVLTVSILYPFFFPHYLAAYSCVIAFLIFRGMMQVSHWRYSGRKVGRPIVLFLILGGLTMGLRQVPFDRMMGLAHNDFKPNLRKQVSTRLLQAGGSHVVFVSYDRDHHFDDEWVYNAANVDGSPIVWTRLSPAANAMEVMRYFKDRQFWVVHVGSNRVKLSSYKSEPSATKSGDWTLERKTGSGR